MQATEDETAERRALEVQRQHLVELMSMNGRILQLLSEISEHERHYGRDDERVDELFRAAIYLKHTDLLHVGRELAALWAASRHDSAQAFRPTPPPTPPPY
ncbi:hypothetical protein EHS25_008675 [Saitozyma podzolica]|uniref:Uncharacterized protein n=1 Tax=Saitozyma podzolica TaxID=1890683 RepID=A0A427YMH7_9TREE|nr:hypothetical protein EHS25_008675 [Saitozyma podzolica]